MNQRFFRAEEAVYELVRTTLDKAWGLPDHGQLTCIEPAATAPRGPDGLAYLSTWDAFCEYETAAEILPQLLSTGSVEEITKEEYLSAVETKTPYLQELPQIPVQ